MTEPYEIESEAWYRAVAEGRESGASDRPYLARTRTDSKVGLIYEGEGCKVFLSTREETRE